MDMDLFKKIGRTVGSAAKSIEKKNRNAAHVSRLRAVIRHSEKAAEKEYLALGRYYYSTLRDAGNAVTEPHCSEIDMIEKRMNAAVAELEKAYSRAAEARAGTREEISLDDVVCMEEPPVAETPVPAACETSEQACAEEANETQEAGADGGENDNLPFEG